jgi:hypothetical protein
MNYIDNFYKKIKFIVNEKEKNIFTTPPILNEKYLIKNRIFYPVFRDEYKIFEHTKCIDKLCIVCNKS